MFKEKSKSSRSAGGRTVSKAEKSNSIAQQKRYSESGRVIDEEDHEEKVVMAMKARRARRQEVVGLHNPEEGRRAQKGSIKIPRIEKSPDTYKLIKKALDSNILFNDCSVEQVDLIIQAMKPKKIAKSFKIITEGDEGYNFYVVQKGKFQFQKKGEVVGECKGGDCFGELALLYYAPRAATVVSLTSSEVWKLDRVTFRQILDSSNKVKQDRIRGALMKSPLFNEQDSDKIEQIVDVSHYQSFRKGDVIIKKDTVGTIFYIVVAGRVQVTRAGEDMADTVFEAGDYFGERSLMTNELRNANVIAIEDTDLVALDRQTFDKFLGHHMKELDYNLGLRVLRSVDLLQDLEPAQFEELVDLMETEHHKKGKKVVQQGEAGKKFFIIKSGEIEIVKEEDKDVRHVAFLKTGSHFGEMALLDNEPRAASAIAKTDCVLFVLDRDQFETLFGPLKALEHSNRMRKKELKKVSVLASQEAQEATIRFEELRQLSILGTGTFGVVKLVQHVKTKETFALKILQKQQIVNYKQQSNVMNEKQILKQSNHPFILKLYETYQNKDKLFMLLELVQGGELFSLLHNTDNKRLEDTHARFYAACVVDALDYLHDRDIVYRDLKPENLMIDTEGYIKVVDFGFAKKVSTKTYTLCGTPEYLAPELVLQKGHNRAVDYWAVGVLIFEMLNGQSPFADLAGEQINICRNIVRLKYSFPKWFPKAAKSIVKQLLQRYPHERLGMKDGAYEIKDHDWFSGVDFEILRKRKKTTPWKPELTNNLDTSNFDDFSGEEIEEISYTGHDEEWTSKF